MRNLVPITRPMGAADLTQAAEDAGKLALALSDLAHGVAAYEAATGAAIAVVDADKAVMVGLDETFRLKREGNEPIATNAQIGHFIADWSQTAAG